jgi:hypothetical protein
MINRQPLARQGGARGDVHKLHSVSKMRIGRWKRKPSATSLPCEIEPRLERGQLASALDRTVE